jgi:hypothetical protein
MVTTETILIMPMSLLVLAPVLESILLFKDCMMMMKMMILMTLAGTKINKKSIQIRCKHQLAAYIFFATMKMRDNERNYNNALEYWPVNESQSPELA